MRLNIAATKNQKNPASPGDKIARQPTKAALVGRIPVSMSGNWQPHKGEGQACYAKYSHYTESWFKLPMPLF